MAEGNTIRQLAQLIEKIVVSKAKTQIFVIIKDESIRKEVEAAPKILTNEKELEIHIGTGKFECPKCGDPHIASECKKYKEPYRFK